MTTALIVDSQKQSADAMARLIGQEFDEIICVQSEAEFHAARAEYGAEIDVVILDLVLDTLVPPVKGKLSLPLTGLDLIREQVIAGHDIGFVVHTQFTHAQVAVECYRAGALSFIPKTPLPPESVTASIRAATARKVSIFRDQFTPADVNHLLACIDETLCDLSRQQIDVITYLYSGLSYAQVASTLGMTSEVSLRNKISRLLRKTPYASMNQVLLNAAKRGWHTLEDDTT